MDPDSGGAYAGLVHAPLRGFASVTLLLTPNKRIPVLAVVVGLILLLGCLWVLEKCFRLSTGRKNRGGLMAPKTLHVISFFLLILPVAGLFTGYYQETGPVAILQAAMYFLGFLGVRALAHKRRANAVSTGDNKSERQ